MEVEGQQELPIEPVKQKGKISYGDLIILWGEANYIVTPLTVTKGQVEHNAQGAFYHDELVGKTLGSKIYSRNNKGFVHALSLTPELWTRALKFRTQILYFADISLITLYLELKPGSVVLEAGLHGYNVAKLIYVRHWKWISFNLYRAVYSA
jgi:tRNA (adenine57-N1/adenine58-N1)-methyltransferase